MTSPSKAATPAPSVPRRVGWVPNGELDVGQWAEVGRRIGSVGRNIQWVLGDWITYGNTRFGERYSRAAKITGYDTQSLMNMVYVASHFSVSRRREDLSWSHHEALASLEPDDQERWLDEAARHRWSVSDLRTMLRMARKEARELGTGDEENGGEDVARVLHCPRCGQEISVE